MPDRTLTVVETAWLAAIPAAAIALAAIVLLGPPLGRALQPAHLARFWPQFQIGVRPEPVEQGRYLIAVAGPVLLAALTLIGMRLRPRRSSWVIRVLVVSAQTALLGALALSVLGQRGVLGTLYPPDILLPAPIDYFTPATLVVAAIGTAVLVAVTASGRLRAPLLRWTRETRWRELATASVALLAILVWLLHAVNTEGTIGATPHEVRYHVQFTLDETFAVIDGRSPLVDYVTQYGALWPYLFAAAMSLLGDTFGVWLTLALTATGLGMLAIYAVLRRVAGSAIRGLLLFLPVLAASFFMVEGTLANRYTYGDYFGAFPLRYTGPSLLAWLVARRLGGSAGRRHWPLFAAAGLVLLNNADVGVAAFGATFAAMLWGDERLTRRSAGIIVREAVCGLALALALVSALTLVRAGSLPHLGLLLRFSRLYALSGFGMYAMPTLGLHIAIYLTFAGALGVATVRALHAEADRALTGMLAWSAAFGLGAGAYFVGRSTPDQLPALFFPWSFCLALLLVPALQAVSRASWRRPPLVAAACAFAFLVAACSLAQTPTPWEQLNRLGHTSPAILTKRGVHRFIAEHTRPGEQTAILSLLGHRVAADLGVDNVSPYSNSLAMPAVEQLTDTIAALRAAGGRKLFLDVEIAATEMQAALDDDGFAFVAEEPGGRTGLWIDRRRG